MKVGMQVGLGPGYTVSGRRKPVWMSYKAWKCVKKKSKVYAKYT